MLQVNWNNNNNNNNNNKHHVTNLAMFDGNLLVHGLENVNLINFATTKTEKKEEDIEMKHW